MTISEQEFLQIELDAGVNPDNPDFVELAENTIEHAAMLLKFESVLDYGAGVGVYSMAAKKAGYMVHAYDKFEVHAKYLQERFPELSVIIPHEWEILTSTTKLRPNLMLFIEVAEHMTDNELEQLFEQVAPRYILFSSTFEKTDNDEMWGHINMKSPSDWIELFSRYGYKFHCNAMYPTPWSMVFKTTSTK